MCGKCEKCDSSVHGKCFSFVSCDILLPLVWVVCATVEFWEMKFCL